MKKMTRNVLLTALVAILSACQPVAQNAAGIALEILFSLIVKKGEKHFFKATTQGLMLEGKHLLRPNLELKYNASLSYEGILFAICSATNQGDCSQRSKEKVAGAYFLVVSYEGSGKDFVYSFSGSDAYCVDVVSGDRVSISGKSDVQRISVQEGSMVTFRGVDSESECNSSKLFSSLVTFKSSNMDSCVVKNLDGEEIGEVPFSHLQQVEIGEYIVASPVFAQGDARQRGIRVQVSHGVEDCSFTMGGCENDSSDYYYCN
jgi:hypothetical protein